MKKSVAIIGTRGYPSYYGGFETAVRKLAPFLVDEGWDVTVYGRNGATKDADPERDYRVTSVVSRGIETKAVSTLSYGLTASLDAVKKRPDVVLIMNVANGFFLPLFQWRGIPTLVNVDGIEWHRAKWGRVAKTMFKLGARATARFATDLVFDSHEIGAFWNKNFQRPGNFIPYGGDIPNDLPVEPGFAHRKYVLIVARFVPENTISEFFEAVATLANESDVIIVGSSGYGGPFDDAAKSLSTKYARVHWLGHVSDDKRLLSLWQHAGVYFHGHSVGGTNPALVQAMACKVPIVARDTIYNREVLDDAALLVQPTGAAIADGIRQLMSDTPLAEALAERALQRATDIYTWQIVCSDYAKALDRLVELNRPVRSKAQRSKRSF